MNKTPTINVLIIAQLLTDGDLLINALRRAGYSVNPEVVRDENFLRERIIAKRWDFICLFANAEQISPERLGLTLRELDKDICCLVMGDIDLPTILQANIPQARMVAGLDTLDTSQQAHMLTRVVNQELQNLEARRDLRTTSASLRELEGRYQSLLNSSTDAIAYLHNGLHAFANQPYSELLGCPKLVDILNTSLLDFVDESDVESVRDYLRKSRFKATEPCTFQLNAPERAGLRVSLQCVPVDYDNEACLQATLRPVSGNTAHQLLAKDILSRDLVTGLLNEQGMIAEIDNIIVDAVFSDAHAAVTILELRGFDDLIALSGKTAANLLLADFARAAEQLLPTNNRIGRIGVNRFAILNPEPKTSGQADEFEAKLGEAITALCPANTRIKIDSGSAAVNELSQDGANVLARASHNLRFRSTHPSNATATKDDSTQRMFERLEKAIANEEFVLAYQPIVNLKQDGVERYEIRVRLQDKDNLIYPPSFLELANQSGLGEKIDRVVIDKSLKLLSDHKESSLQLTINLTHNSLVSPRFLPWLSERLHTSRISAEKLVLQVSELDIMSFPEQISLFGGRLTELEIALSITHFGCTLSPFKYLPQYHVKYVKLDRSLLDDIEIDTDKRTALANTVKTLHASGILVIAPMIDKIELLPLLWQANLNFVQGNSLQEPSDRMNYSFLQEEEITLSSF
jgi:EAL domain-containing protein (putative c-di-GMP-specific phosphodiesterase class I)/PAS domain-containing protein